MALPSPKSVAYDDDELYDRTRGMPNGYEPPEYPPGLLFCISKEDLAEAGGEGGDVADVMHFSAMGEVTSVFKSMKDVRIELEVTEFAGPDGKFFDLENPVGVCLCGPELEKIELSDSAERGDLIHLIGSVRIEHASSTEYGGDMVGLQITDLTYEDESEESRKG